MSWLPWRQRSWLQAHASYWPSRMPRQCVQTPLWSLIVWRARHAGYVFEGPPVAYLAHLPRYLQPPEAPQLDSHHPPPLHHHPYLARLPRYLDLPEAPQLDSHNHQPPRPPDHPPQPLPTTRP